MRPTRLAGPIGRAALSPLAALYGRALEARARLYRSGGLPSRRAACPVVSVGNLTFGGTFTFYGVIIVRRGFKTQAGGNPKVYGAVLAQDSNLATTAFAGDAVINYSACSLMRMQNATSIPAMLRSRSWVELM